MATVYTLGNPCGRVVKNLGWLRRHASNVLNLTVQPIGPEGCWLIATCTGGRTYVGYFESLAVCRQWLQRPSLDGVPTTELARDEEDS